MLPWSCNMSVTETWGFFPSFCGFMCEVKLFGLSSGPLTSGTYVCLWEVLAQSRRNTNKCTTQILLQTLLQSHRTGETDWPLRHWFLEQNLGVGLSWSRFSPAATLPESRGFSSSLEVLKYSSRVVNLNCHHIYLSLNQGQSQCAHLSLDVAAEESSIVRLLTQPHQKGWPAHPLWLIFHYWIFFSLCLHAMLTWKLNSIAWCCGPSSHFTRVPKDLARSLFSWPWCLSVKQKHLFPLQWFLRFLSPLIQLQEELISSKAQ